MVTKASFDYAVLRVVPRVERQEFLEYRRAGFTVSRLSSIRPQRGHDGAVLRHG